MIRPSIRQGTLRRVCCVAATVLGMVLIQRSAAAQSTIRQPRAHLAYGVELEPHLDLGSGPPGPGTGSGVGLGGRASIMILPEGFIGPLNDSVAIGFGLDVMRYRGAGGLYGECTHFEPGPNNTNICTAVDTYGGPTSYVFVPVVMQWSFWFTRQWSAFGEPGLTFYSVDGGLSVSPSLFLGGRFLLNNKAALTLRLGWPTISFGVSFFL